MHGLWVYSWILAPAVLLLSLSLSCLRAGRVEEHAGKAEPSEEEEVVILGEFDRDWIINWHPAYSEQYRNYELRKEVVEWLQDLSDGVTIKVYWGTWCEDSEKFVPPFLKLLDAIPFETSFIAIDREKQQPEDLLAGETIELVPTFIVYRDGEELGRIVESPHARIEDDLLNLLLD